jgi:antitoxin component of RelBE/YafQ-DinJ toxin-antitoxin module
MSDKEMVSVRLHTDTKQRVERYAEEHDVSRSTAIRRLLEKGADLEETGLTVAASHQPREDEQEEEEKEVVADGGQVVRPILNFLGATYAFVSLSMFSLLSLAALGNIALPFIDYTSMFGMMFSSLLLVAVIMVVLYSNYPEKADRLLYSGVRKASRFGSSLHGGSKA